MKDLKNKFDALVARMRTKESQEAARSLFSATPQELGEAYRRGKTPRTSISSPLRVDAIQLNESGSAIGMTICPGKRGPSQHGGPWERDLHTDIAALHAWGCKALLTVMEQGELESYGVSSLGKMAIASDMQWFYIPITDGDPPDERFDAVWPVVGRALLSTVRNDSRIVVHCLGGLGRTGMIVCLLLVELGYTPDAALELVRKIRPGAVETKAQEAYVLAYSPMLAS